MEKSKMGQAEKVLRDLGKSIDDLFSKSKNSSEDIKKEFDERIEELKRNKKTLEEKFASFKEPNWCFTIIIHMFLVFTTCNPL